MRKESLIFLKNLSFFIVFITISVGLYRYGDSAISLKGIFVLDDTSLYKYTFILCVVVFGVVQIILESKDLKEATRKEVLRFPLYLTILVNALALFYVAYKVMTANISLISFYETNQYYILIHYVGLAFVLEEMFHFRPDNEHLFKKKRILFAISLVIANAIVVILSVLNSFNDDVSLFSVYSAHEILMEIHFVSVFVLVSMVAYKTFMRKKIK